MLSENQPDEAADAMQLANLRDTLGYEAQWSLINLVRRWP
jgi:hypothetical protein